MSLLFWVSALLLNFANYAHLSLAAPADLSARADLPPGFHSPPSYPTPKGGWVNEWADAYAKAYAVVCQMTLAEKVNLTTGGGFMMGRCVGETGSAPRFGIPRLCLQDGPLGIRATDHNTAFPAGITVGATFDKHLMFERGKALGKEFRGKGINVYLGPSVGPLGRKPRGGRNWEGFGADPVLQAIAGAETIKGVQGEGVIATVKHLVGNEQEMWRMTNIVQPAYSANIDDRTLHELYLWPFADAVKVGVGSVMMAYNDVNGSASCQNSKLMNGILKDELGFQGFVMTDWFAHLSGVASALAGLDMSMPGDAFLKIPLTGQSLWAGELSRSVLNASLPVDRLNDMVTRIVATWFQMGQDKDYPPPNFSAFTDKKEGLLYPAALFSPKGVVNEYVNVQGNHHEVARAVARDGITLLKNDDNFLPLSRNASIKVFGSDAGTNPNGINSCVDKGCNKGVLTMGWGSGSANLPYLITPQDAIKKISPNAEFHLKDKFPRDIKVSPEDVALVFVSSDSGENYITVLGNYGDRNHAGLYLWYGGDELIQEAAKRFSNVVVVINAVGPVIMEKWIDLPSVKSVVLAHLPGQEAGSSLVDILYGDYSPSGHLPYSIAKTESDYGKSVELLYGWWGQIQDTYTEGLYIDYRHLQKENIAPRFPFGFGLSYTTFKFSEPTMSAGVPLSEYPPPPKPRGKTPVYSNAIPPASEVAFPQGFKKIWRYLYPYLNNPEKIKAEPGKYPYPVGYSTEAQPEPRAGGGEGGNPALWDIVFTTSIKVTNTGKKPGRAVAQLYVEIPKDPAFPTPKLQLREFEKTEILQPGESTVLKMNVRRRDVSVWDVKVQDWKVLGGGKGLKFWFGESVEHQKAVCEVGKGCQLSDGSS